MKKDRAKYILLPLVIAIWGGVIWRFLAGPGEDALPPPVTLKSGSTVAPAAQDSFSLLLSYADPFLGGLAPEPLPVASRPAVDPGTSRPQAPASPPVQVPPTFDWNTVAYYGLVQQTGGTGKRVGVMRINGKTWQVTEGITYEGISVLKVWDDSVRVRRDKEIKTLRNR